MTTSEQGEVEVDCLNPTGGCLMQEKDSLSEIRGSALSWSTWSVKCQSNDVKWTLIYHICLVSISLDVALHCHILLAVPDYVILPAHDLATPRAAPV